MTYGEGRLLQTYRRTHSYSTRAHTHTHRHFITIMLQLYRNNFLAFRKCRVPSRDDKLRNAVYEYLVDAVRELLFNGHDSSSSSSTGSSCAQEAENIVNRLIVTYYKDPPARDHVVPSYVLFLSADVLHEYQIHPTAIVRIANRRAESDRLGMFQLYGLTTGEFPPHGAVPQPFQVYDQCALVRQELYPLEFTPREPWLPLLHFLLHPSEIDADEESMVNLCLVPIWLFGLFCIGLLFVVARHLAEWMTARSNDTMLYLLLSVPTSAAIALWTMRVIQSCTANYA